MRNDDESTATQIRSVLAREGYHLSIRTVLRSRTELGWTYRGRDVNKAKRLEWARANLGSNFEDEILQTSAASRWKATAASAAINGESFPRTSRG